MDYVFTHNSEGFMMRGHTVLEKLAHLFHMQSIWIKANPYYKKLLANSKLDMDQTCKCVNDINLNGIGRAMEVAHSVLNGSEIYHDLADNCFWWHMKKGK